MDLPVSDAKIQLPQTSWEQRKPYYEDIETLLLPGFLSHNMELGGVQFAIRSPNPGDLYLIRNRVGMSKKEEDWLLWGLSTCVWMLDGVVLLGDPAAPTKVASVLRGLPTRVRRAMYTLYIKLFSRAREAMQGILAFCYEERSRSLWLQIGGSGNPSRAEVSGIPHAGRLGTNLTQRMWMSYNTLEDQRIEELSAWSHAKFIASAQHPKGVKQVSQREKQLQESRATHQQEERDLYYYRKIGMVTQEDTLKDGRKVFRTKKSLQELKGEYENWVAGGMDQHDMVIQEWKDKITRRYEEERRRREGQWQQYQEELQAENAEEEEKITPTVLVGYDAKQLAEIMGERQKTSPQARRVYDDAQVKAREHIYREHLKREVLPPPEEGFFPKEAIPSPQQGGGVPLDDQIRNRKAHLNLGPLPTREE